MKCQRTEMILRNSGTEQPLVFSGEGAGGEGKGCGEVGYMQLPGALVDS